MSSAGTMSWSPSSRRRAWRLDKGLDGLMPEAGEAGARPAAGVVSFARRDSMRRTASAAGVLWILGLAGPARGEDAAPRAGGADLIDSALALAGWTRADL